MFGRLKGVAVGCAALAIASTALYAAGNYSTYPIVGGASFCVSTVGVNGQAGNTGQGGGAAGTNGAYCAQTVPAGPPALTGTEVIPMDTGLAGGAPPQTVVMPITNLHAGYNAVVTTGTTFTVPPNVSDVILNLAATTMAVSLPALPYDNEVVTVSNTSTIVSSFSITPTAGTGQVIIGGAAATALAAETGTTSVLNQVAYLYRAANNSWYRLK